MRKLFIIAITLLLSVTQVQSQDFILIGNLKTVELMSYDASLDYWSTDLSVPTSGIFFMERTGDYISVDWPGQSGYYNVVENYPSNDTPATFMLGCRSDQGLGTLITLYDQSIYFVFEDYNQVRRSISYTGNNWQILE
jgi:hypothetical protein